ncbi:MAG: glycogen debranching protein, partial [Myxococcaceae bacterium]
TEASRSDGPNAVLDELRGAIDRLHREGIEVILDVVYNHTCEGSELGPTLSFRGLDNAAYYWLHPKTPRHCLDFTGCGNSLNASHPFVLKLIADSLRYWVQEMRVDGFRFDLTTTHGRVGAGEFSPHAPFFEMIHQDPVLSRVKLIAEPWDIGPDGYKLANFPVVWAEWNDRYREAVRRFWKGDDRQAGEIGYRLTGSSDLFKLSGRRPTASINYVAVHDGYTLNDLVSYNRKKNEANGENNRDGRDDSDSWNCGAEGDTLDPAVIALRERQKRNFLATLFVSVGTPMLYMGDEMGRSQKGNNNGYCQDNQISWVDWELTDRDRDLLDFTAHMIHLRKGQPVFERRHFFQGATIGDSRYKDLVWFRPDGAELTAADWDKPSFKSLGYLLGGDAIQTRDHLGKRIVGDTLLVLANAHHQAVEFTLPPVEWGAEWEILVDTAHAEPIRRAAPAGGSLKLEPRSMMVLRHDPA